MLQGAQGQSSWGVPSSDYAVFSHAYASIEAKGPITNQRIAFSSDLGLKAL